MILEFQSKEDAEIAFLRLQGCGQIDERLKNTVFSNRLDVKIKWFDIEDIRWFLRPIQVNQIAESKKKEE